MRLTHLIWAGLGGVAAATGVGLALLSPAGAQAPTPTTRRVEPKPAISPETPKPPTVVTLRGVTGASKWEYEFADAPPYRAALHKLLTDKGQAGWEYAGTLVPGGAKGEQPAPADGVPGGSSGVPGGLPRAEVNVSGPGKTVVVFKRASGGMVGTAGMFGGNTLNSSGAPSARDVTIYRMPGEGGTYAQRFGSKVTPSAATPKSGPSTREMEPQPRVTVLDGPVAKPQEFTDVILNLPEGVAAGPELKSVLTKFTVLVNYGNRDVSFRQLNYVVVGNKLVLLEVDAATAERVRKLCEQLFGMK